MNVKGKLLALTIAGILIGESRSSGGKIQWPSTNRKPKFTAAELKRIRSLPKRERKALVKELRAKYWATEKEAA